MSYYGSLKIEANTLNSLAKESWKVFDLILITVLVSIPFVFVFTRRPWIIYYPASFFRHRALRLIGILFLATLTSCNSASVASLPRPNTPQENAPTVSLSSNVKLSKPRSTALKSTDWPTYHHDNARTGYLPNVPDPKQLIHAWTAKLDGAAYAEPLVIGDSVIVATEGDSLYSLDARTGQVQWRTNVGNPVPTSTLTCIATINVIGITGTPVYDPASGLVFAVAEVTGPSHVLVGVDLNTGKVVIQRPVDVPKMAPPRIYLQRPALALSNGMVYIGFGSLADDCGNYHGTIVASQTDGGGPLLSYQVPTLTEGGGIWGTSGPAVDQNGKIYVSTANEDAMNSTTWDLSNAVLRLSPTLQLEDSFAPAQWLIQDTGNQDLGSMGPSLLPGGLVFIAGKAGTGYLLHSNALGGIGGQAAEVQVCQGLALG